jgi:hypothetical protein
MLDSGVLDDSGSGRSLRDVGGRAVSVSLRGLAEAGRFAGEGEMRKQSWECKDNNAECVNRMMPNRSWTALLRRAVEWLLCLQARVAEDKNSLTSVRMRA